MRVIRVDSAAAHYRTPLVVRASLPRTFWSLGAFIELALVCCGVYLLAEAGLNPLEADQASVLSAGVILALAIVLLFYMIRPRRKHVLPRAEASRLSRDWADELSHTAHDIAVQARREAEQALQEKKDLPGPM